MDEVLDDGNGATSHACDLGHHRTRADEMHKLRKLATIWRGVGEGERHPYVRASAVRLLCSST